MSLFSPVNIPRRWRRLAWALIAVIALSLSLFFHHAGLSWREIVICIVIYLAMSWLTLFAVWRKPRKS